MGRELGDRYAVAGTALMELQWTSKAVSDLARLYEFLALVNRPAAAFTAQQLAAASSTLLTNPRLGERLDEFEPRDVRRLLVGGYEIRYETAGAIVYLLRLWHSR
jgi:plasmid stabilization system protein ParE